jgi:hypothetical protein
MLKYIIGTFTHASVCVQGVPCTAAGQTEALIGANCVVASLAHSAVVIVQLTLVNIYQNRLINQVKDHTERSQGGK